jgi:hypothetical protein
MIFDTETKIMFGIFIILLFFSSYKYTIIYLLFWIFVYLFGFFFTSIGLDLDVTKLDKSEIFYQEFTGDYSKLYNKLSDFQIIKKKFKLAPLDYYPFGIFYDDPTEVNDVTKCRAVYGIIKFSKEENKELLIFCKNENFKYDTIPETQCFNGNYFSMFHLQNSFIFIAKLIIEMTNMKFFRRLFLPRWKENKVKMARINYRKHYGVLEIIRENKIDMYVPVENEKKFLFHSIDIAPIKLKKNKK